MTESIEGSSLCTGQDGVEAGGEGATEVNNSTNAEMTKALSVISMLQKNTGQDVMDLSEDDLLLLTGFKGWLGRLTQMASVRRVLQGTFTDGFVPICSLRPGICYKNSGDPSPGGR